MSWLSWLRRPPSDPVAAAYAANTPRRVPSRTPLDALRFIVLDAETSGFNVGSDRLLSLAIVPVRAGRIPLGGICSWIFRQDKVPLNEATAVHGILPAETADGETEQAILQELLPELAGAVVVGHHIDFDLAMLDEATRRHFGLRLRNPRIDTATLAMRAVEAFAKTAYPGQRPPTLDELCSHCGVPTIDRHTAAGDAYTTAELFLVLCARMQRLRGRPLTAADLGLG
jgi:DNA polymerase-3 subunit epsilon